MSFQWNKTGVEKEEEWGQRGGRHHTHEGLTTGA